MDVVSTSPGDRADSMTQAQPYRITRQVPLVSLETFCCSLQKALTCTYPPAELKRIWRLYVSAECPACGILVSGDELRALALPPCIELASAKIGRMRLGDCARLGCGAWHYSVHFWNQENIDWPNLLDAAEQPAQEGATPAQAPRRSWLPGLGGVTLRYAPRAAAVLGVLLVLWLVREVYLGGRIPFVREPEKFTVETTPPDPSWPAPMDGSDGPMR